jgi:hypothetical protein
LGSPLQKIIDFEKSQSKFKLLSKDKYCQNDDTLSYHLKQEKSEHDALARKNGSLANNLNQVQFKNSVIKQSVKSLCIQFENNNIQNHVESLKRPQNLFSEPNCETRQNLSSFVPQICTNVTCDKSASKTFNKSDLTDAPSLFILKDKTTSFSKQKVISPQYHKKLALVVRKDDEMAKQEFSKKVNSPRIDCPFESNFSIDTLNSHLQQSDKLKNESNQVMARANESSSALQKTVRDKINSSNEERLNTDKLIQGLKAKVRSLEDSYEKLKCKYQVETTRNANLSEEKNFQIKEAHVQVTQMSDQVVFTF